MLGKTYLLIRKRYIVFHLGKRISFQRYLVCAPQCPTPPIHLWNPQYRKVSLRVANCHTSISDVAWSACIQNPSEPTSKLQDKRFTIRANILVLCNSFPKWVGGMDTRGTRHKKQVVPEKKILFCYRNIILCWGRHTGSKNRSRSTGIDNEGR